LPTDAAFLDALRLRRAVRLAVGVTLAMWISQAVAWTLSFLAPILAAFILSMPVSRPPAKFFIGIVVALVASIYGSFIFLPLLLHQPLAGLIIVGVVLFHTFYFTARGKSAAIGTLLTIGITVTVALGSVSVDVLLVIAKGLMWGVLVGALVAWCVHAVLPDPPMERRAPPAAPPPLPYPVRRALRSLAIVMPVAVWFLMSPASATNVGVMIKVAAMGQEATGAKAGTAAGSLIASTVIGGIAAVIGWEVLSAWPSLTMYVLITATATLWFGGRIFAGAGLSKHGDTWSFALLTMIIVLAPAVLDTQFGSAADVAFYDRLMMFAGASAYGVVAVYVFNAFWPISDTATPDAAPAAGP